MTYPDLMDYKSNACNQTPGRKAVLAAVQLPPPVNGLSSVNAAIVDLLRLSGDLGGVLSVGPMASKWRAVRTASRVARVAWATTAMIFYWVRGTRILYIPPDAANGLTLQLPLVMLARLLGFKVCYHHHNSSYINKPSRALSRLLLAGPKGALHITLCQKMLNSFEEAYKWELNSSKGRLTILSNAFMVDSQPFSNCRSGTITIGHLANLSRAKGVFVFLDLFEACIKEGLDIKAVVAGPAMESDVRSALEACAKRHHDSFQWIGPAYGDHKVAFYKMLDVFVFPSCYISEAQPLVLLEALSFGTAILATDTGCIRCDHDTSPGEIFANEAFYSEALKWLTELSSDPERRAAIPAQAASRFKALKEDVALSLTDTLARIIAA